MLRAKTTVHRAAMQKPGQGRIRQIGYNKQENVLGVCTVTRGIRGLTELPASP